MGISLARVGCKLKRNTLKKIRNSFISGRNSRATWIILSISLILVACSSDPQLTPDSRILITPGSFEFEIEEFKDSDNDCVFSPDFFQDVPVSLVVVDGSNRALGNSPVTVYLDFAANTFSGRESLQLFFDTNGNGVVDTPDELMSGVGDDAFSVRTDEYTASTLLLLRINLSCGFRGSLYAFSGPAAAVIEIDVVALQNGDDVDTLVEAN